MVWLLWKTVNRFLRKLSIGLPYGLGCRGVSMETQRIFTGSLKVGRSPNLGQEDRPSDLGVDVSLDVRCLARAMALGKAVFH